MQHPVCREHGDSSPNKAASGSLAVLTALVCMQWTLLQVPAVNRRVDTMVALGGDLYVYGGAREMADGEETILSDILVARAQNGIVNQPWKRFAVSESSPFLHSDPDLMQSLQEHKDAPHGNAPSNVSESALTCS